MRGGLLTSIMLQQAMAMMKTIVVTGANKGVGRAIVERLLRDYEDTFVYLGARDAARGAAACEEIVAALPTAAGRLESLELDVSDDASVKRAAESVAAARPSVYAVMNNAGIGFGKGFSATLETNFFGPMRVCDAFLPLLTKHSRVVNMASASAPNFVSRCGVAEHRSALVDPASVAEVVAIARSYQDMTDYEDSAYGLSKACLNAYTACFAREHPDLVVNSCTPGYILTDMTRDMGGATKPPDEGTTAPVYLLMDEEVASLPTGWYYGSDAKRSPLDRYRAPGDPPYEGP